MRAQGVVGQVRVAIQDTLLFSSLLLTVLLSTLVSAQVAPAPVYQFEHTFFPNRTLYIRGGLNQGRVVPQFYSLDMSPLLTHSNNLTWKKLNEVGPITDFRSALPMTPNKENQGIAYFGEGSVMMNYNAVTNTWLTAAIPICLSPANANPSVRGSNLQTALTDPVSGLMYIPGGYSAQSQMLVFEDANNVCSGVPMPANVVDSKYALSESKGAIYMVGNTTSKSAPSIWEFTIATKIWKNIVSRQCQGTPKTNNKKKIPLSQYVLVSSFFSRLLSP